MKKLLLGLAMLVSLFSIPAFAAEGYPTVPPLKVDVGHGVMCSPRFGGTKWPVQGQYPTVASARFFYCGTNTVSMRSQVYGGLKYLTPHVQALMIANNVSVFVFDSPLQYAAANGLNPLATYNAQLNKPAFSVFGASNFIVVYENVPDTSAGHSYPDLKPEPGTLQDHDARHETGHHYDLYRGTQLHGAGQRLSLQTVGPNVFGTLYPDDKAFNLANNPNAAADLVTYNYWWNNKEELFAELFATSTGSGARQPLDQRTQQYFECTKKFVNNFYMSNVAPTSPYPTQCTP